MISFDKLMVVSFNYPLFDLMYRYDMVVTVFDVVLQLFPQDHQLGHGKLSTALA